MLADNPYVVYVNDQLCLGPKRKKILDLVGSYSAPVYIYDEDIIRLQAENLRSVVPAQTALHFAMKANSNPSVLRVLREMGFGVDVVSVGEAKRAIECGFKASQIIFSGVGKTKSEIEYAIKTGLKQINIESISELERVSQLASSLNTAVEIAVRINPDISVQTHPYISTGLKENKFGLEIPLIGQFSERVRANKLLKWVGLSVHLGSQIFEVNPLRDALKTLLELRASLRSEFPISRIDLGGGVGIDYEKFDHAKERNFLKIFGSMIHEELEDFDGEFILEPGRSLVAHSGILICQVQYIKRTSSKTFVVVDSGMNHLLRPALYSAQHQVYGLNKKDRAPIVCDVVGPICESSDRLRTGYTMPEPREGDLLAICDVGAYGFVMASHYNLHEMPMEKLV